MDGAANPFARCVNPHLADLLRKLWLDKQFVRGEGCELFDKEGRRYLDCISAYGALPFGFNPAEIWQSLLEVQNEAEPSFIQPSLLGAAGELARATAGRRSGEHAARHLYQQRGGIGRGRDQAVPCRDGTQGDSLHGQ